MAWGKTHLKINKLMVLPVAVVGTIFVGPIEAIGLVGGIIVGIFVTPDLDLNKLTYSGRLVYNFCPLIGVIWRGIWYPYSRVIPHRHWVSHIPVLSTLLRLLYLSPVTIPILVYLPGLFWSVTGGLLLSDVVHFFTDCITSFVRKRTKIRIRKSRNRSTYHATKVNG